MCTFDSKNNDETHRSQPEIRSGDRRASSLPRTRALSAGPEAILAGLGRLSLSEPICWARYGPCSPVGPALFLTLFVFNKN